MADACLEFSVIARSASDEAIHAFRAALWIASLALATTILKRKAFGLFEIKSVSANPGPLRQNPKNLARSASS
jgi:hypothetical protein